MELIISILFFAIASAVCIQLFAKSHILDKKTSMENMAIVKCENFCEVYSSLVESYDDAAERDKEMASVTGATVSGTGSLAAYYDADWNPCEAQNATYGLEFTDSGLDGSDGLYKANVKVYEVGKESDGPIYELPVVKHVAKVL